MWAELAAGAVKGLTGTAPAGPSSAFGEASGRADNSGWNVNFGGIQGTSGSGGGGGGVGGISLPMIALIALVGFVVLRKLK